MKGKVNIEKLRSSLVKKYGEEVATELAGVTEWIPTGSKWLDMIINAGEMGGWPVGRIIEVAGEPGAGKSFLAVIAVANALEMGITPVIFDTEGSWDSDFCAEAGFSVRDDTLHLTPPDVETLFEIVDQCLDSGDRYLFVWDSLASTDSRRESESGQDRDATMFDRARAVSRGWNSIQMKLSRSQSTFMVLNQLYTKPGVGKYQNAMNAFTEGDGIHYTTHGGMKSQHAYSLRIRLMIKRSKKNRVNAEEEVVVASGKKGGLQVGNDIRVIITKSRFGSLHREAQIGIQYGGGDVRIMDEESWLTVIEGTDAFKRKAGWRVFSWGGEEWKWQGDHGFLPAIKDDPSLYGAVLDCMHHELVRKFEKKSETEEGEESAEGEKE